MTTAAKAPQRSKLDAIATTMYSKVLEPGQWTRTTLNHGLDMILQRSDDQRWRLALAREGVYPSDTEVAICRESFEVPTGAEEARKMKMHTHPKSRRTITYHVVELTWIDQQ